MHASAVGDRLERAHRLAAVMGPIQPDGSWMRRRVIGIPAHYEPASSSCSGGAYYSKCTFYPGGWVDAYPGGWVDAQIMDDETYPVRPDTVLPDKPGHMPDPAPAPPPPADPAPQSAATRVVA